MADYTESPTLFGPEGNLFGMFTQSQPAQASVGCLVLNTGVNHHIGPHRINVKIARHLAALGIPTLRFDLSGIGDSAGSRSQRAFRAQAVEDIKAALDHLEQQHGLRRSLVIGICSGAYNAIEIALADERVAGLVAYDGPMYLTPGVRIERKLRRMAAFPFNAAVRDTYPWWNDLRRWLAEHDAQARERTLVRLRLRRPASGGAAEGSIFATDDGAVSAAEFERKLLTLADRGVAVSLMYSTTYNDFDRNHSMLAQLRGSRLFDRVQYRFLPDVDHTATTLAMQGKLLQALGDWARNVALGASEPQASLQGASPPAAQGHWREAACS